MYGTIAVAALLMTGSGLLLRMHLGAARGASVRAMDERERTFLEQQRRRRVWSSVVIGLIGAALLGSPWFQRPAELRFWCYWIALLAGVGWITLLAAGDALHTRRHYRAQLHDELRQTVRLQAEILGRLRHRNNGDAPADADLPRNSA
jgi:thiosulfate reductase cytochrome b subunit